MNKRPGYEKYINKFMDSFEGVNLDKLVKDNITRSNDLSSMRGKNALDADGLLYDLKKEAGSNLDSYLKENKDELLSILDKNRIEVLESSDDATKNKVIQAAMSKYKYLVTLKVGSQGGAAYLNSALANKSANEMMDVYGLDKGDLIVKGFTLKVKDSEPNLIISALEKDFKDKVKSDSLLKAKYINFYSFFNLTRLNDRSPQFLSAFNETIETNKSTIKSLIQKLGVELFSIQPEYVTKAELNLFKFIQKELGFKFYSKHGRETYISNNADIIRRIQNDIHQYGDVTSTNVK